jgi:hypothetical protein
LGKNGDGPMRRELRIALGVMGAPVVIGVAISLALQPELLRPPGGAARTGATSLL